MASPRDPARSKENAPITEPGPMFDEPAAEVADGDEPEVASHSMLELADERDRKLGPLTRRRTRWEMV